MTPESAGANGSGADNLAIAFRKRLGQLGAPGVVPLEVAEKFEADSQYFPTPIQMFQFYDKYSRFSHETGRRETWVETVDRGVSYLKQLSEHRLSDEVYLRIRQHILEMKSMPSMRLLAMAGPAAERHNACIYNCSYLPIEDLRAFSEALLISMSGCGVGFSVEGKYVSNLPEIRRQTGEHLGVHTIPDTTEGWIAAVNFGLETWFGGKDIDFDYSEIRPAGSVLKVKGGRASGPEPLKEFMAFARKRILAKQGIKLSSLDAHDIMCMVGQAAVSGGVRRTAMISLFDFDDREMLECKNGDNLSGNEQRWNANNSAVWPEGITNEQIIEQFRVMHEGQRGEPGIFNRGAANATKPARRKDAEFGTNPCGEIYLRPYQFCNLTIAVARQEDTLESLKEKVEVAAIIGTIQSMATNFPGLRDKWRQNCEEERLLGVDITGQMDVPHLMTPENLGLLKDVAVATNARYADLLGIARSAAVTCNKPSGNSSQLLDCSPGIHARHSRQYIRNIRVSAHSPMYKVLREANVPMNPENGSTSDNAITWVIPFPVQAPEGALTRGDLSAIAQLEFWLRNKTNWTEHNPSCTINYSEEELPQMVEWVIAHQSQIGGLSFLQRFDAQYDQMPYQEVTREEFLVATASFPQIDFSRIVLHESEDYTTASQELACFADGCEVDPEPLGQEYYSNTSGENAGSPITRPEKSIPTRPQRITGEYFDSGVAQAGE